MNETLHLCQHGLLGDLEKIPTRTILNTLDDDGNNALLCAAANPNSDCLRFVLNLGAKALWISNINGEGPLHIAARENLPQNIELLLEKKLFDIDNRDSCGRTPLHLAVLHNSADAVDCLLGFGASPSSKDNNTYSPGTPANSLFIRTEDTRTLVEIFLRRGFSSELALAAAE